MRQFVNKRLKETVPQFRASSNEQGYGSCVSRYASEPDARIEKHFNLRNPLVRKGYPLFLAFFRRLIISEILRAQA